MRGKLIAVKSLMIYFECRYVNEMEINCEMENLKATIKPFASNV